MSGEDDFNAVFGSRRPVFPDQPPRADVAPAPSAASPSFAGDEPYKPYGAFTSGQAGGETCEVRCWTDHGASPEGIIFQYRFLMQIGWKADEELRLYLPDSIVVIEGKKLDELRDKLSRRMVRYIQQFHPQKWPVPIAGEPTIDRIQVIRATPING